MSLAGGATIDGAGVSLQPLDPQAHHADLWDAIGRHDDLWTFMLAGPFPTSDVFRAWLEERSGKSDPAHLAVCVDGRASGMLAFMAIRPEHGVVEIGHVAYSPALQRTRAATAAFAAALSHAFSHGFRRVEWKCDAANTASCRAALRLGFVAEGLFRQHMIVKGRNRDTAWFSLIDRDWPIVAKRFDAWLSPPNFDPQGRQLRRLGEIVL